VAENETKYVSRLFLSQIIDERTLQLIQLGLSQELERGTIIVENREGAWHHIPLPRREVYWCPFCFSLRTELGGEELCNKSDNAIAEQVYRREIVGAREFTCHMGLTELAMGIQVGSDISAIFMTGELLKEANREAVRQKVKGLKKRLKKQKLTESQLSELERKMESIPVADDCTLTELKNRLGELGGYIRSLADTKFRFEKLRHDFRSLGLMIVRGNVELILDHCLEKDPDPELQELCDDLESGLEYLTQRADADAIYSGIEKGLKPRLVIRHTSLYEVLRRIKRMLKREAEHRHIEINIGPELGQVKNIQMDESSMFVALSNIVQNAAKYTYRGTDENPHTVDIEYSREHSCSERIAIEIANFGMGVAVDDKERIFAPYTQGRNFDRKRFIPGTGLGLYTAKQIIEEHGGEIDVWCETFDRGLTAEQLAAAEYGTRGWKTVFTVTLPVRGRLF